MRIARAAMILICCVLCGQLTPAGAQAPLETQRVRLAVGGKPGLFYLPLTISERLGYFKAEGLNVEISDFPGGGRALQALIGGSADIVTGSFDHTIQMHAKGQPIIAVVLLGRYPGFVLGVGNAKAESYKGPASLKGMKIGVSAPGSSTHFMALHLMAKVGLKAQDASFIGVGASASAVAAMQRGDIDAIVNVDPVISVLENRKLIKVVADSRTQSGTQDVYGGPMPAAALYLQPAFAEKNPRTTQALVNALVRGLRWIQANSAEEIARVMPEEYALGDKAMYIESIKHSLAMYSPDGRLSIEGAETALRVLNEFDPSVAGATIDLTKTMTNSFVDKVPAP